MVGVGLFVALQVKQGKESSRFAIFDAFNEEAGRDAHLAGQVAAALMAHAPELLAEPPTIEKVDILAGKLPSSRSVDAR